MRKAVFFIFMTTMIGLCASSYACTTPLDSTAPNTTRYMTEYSREPSKINGVFPYDIELRTADGKVFNSGKLLKESDKPTVLVFWLTTCYPCRLELEAYKQHFDAWAKETKFRMVAISTDFPDKADAFVNTVKEQKWQFEAYHDFNREFRLVMPGELNGLPQLFLFDKKGIMVYHHKRYTPGDENALYEEIKKAAN